MMMNCFLKNGWPKKVCYALVPTGAIILCFHHLNPSTYYHQYSNLYKSWMANVSSYFKGCYAVIINTTTRLLKIRHWKLNEKSRKLRSDENVFFFDLWNGSLGKYKSLTILIFTIFQKISAFVIVDRPLFWYFFKISSNSIVASVCDDDNDDEFFVWCSWLWNDQKAELLARNGST